MRVNAMRCATAYSEMLFESDLASDAMAEEIREAIGATEGGLGFLFAHIEIDHAELQGLLAKRLGIRIVGCTTFSEATDTGFHDASASLLVLAGEGLSFGIGCAEGIAADPAGSARAAYHQARVQLGGAPSAVLVFSDSCLSSVSEPVLAELNALAGVDGALLAGAEPGDNGRFERTFQFCDGRVLSDGIVIAMLAGDALPLAASRSGWAPVSEPMTVTRAEGTRVFELDGEAPARVYRRFIGQDLDPDVLATYPLVLEAERAPFGCPAVRSVFRFEPPAGAAVTAGRIPAGTRVRIGSGNSGDALAAVSEAAEALYRALDGRAPHCLLFFSCGGRKLVLGLSVEQELAVLQRVFGSAVPICGFYGYGEFGPQLFLPGAPMRSEFYNTAFVLVAL